MAFYRLRKIKGHYHLIKEAYASDRKRKITLWSIPIERIERICLLLKNLKEELAKIVEAVKNGVIVVRGVGFEPTQAYAIGSSARPL